MPRKKYEERITKGLSGLKADTEISDPLFNRESSPASVGEIFQMIADDIEDGRRDHPVHKLFAGAGFSPQSPYHWFYLIKELAVVHYKDGKRGRPTIGTRQRRAKLRGAMKRLAIEHGNIGKLKLAEKFLEELKRTEEPDEDFKGLKTVAGVLSAMRPRKSKTGLSAKSSRTRK